MVLSRDNKQVTSYQYSIIKAHDTGNVSPRQSHITTTIIIKQVLFIITVTFFRTLIIMIVFSHEIKNRYQTKNKPEKIPLLRSEKPDTWTRSAIHRILLVNNEDWILIVYRSYTIYQTGLKTSSLDLAGQNFKNCTL